jgi:CxxC motif-containing protein (DUF1111 family)
VSRSNSAPVIKVLKRLKVLLCNLKSHVNIVQQHKHGVRRSTTFSIRKPSSDGTSRVAVFQVVCPVSHVLDQMLDDGVADGLLGVQEATERVRLHSTTPPLVVAGLCQRPRTCTMILLDGTGQSASSFAGATIA